MAFPCDFLEGVLESEGISIENRTRFGPWWVSLAFFCIFHLKILASLPLEKSAPFSFFSNCCRAGFPHGRPGIVLSKRR